MEMPFYFTAAGLAFGDTLAIDMDNANALPQGATLESAKILLQTITTLPLDANVHIKFYDAFWNEIMMKDLGLMESGIPNASGIITTPNILDSEIALDATEALTLLNAKHIIAEGTMNTFNAGNDPVKLRTNATLKLDLGVQLQVKYEL